MVATPTNYLCGNRQVYIHIHIRDRGSDLYVGIDMVKNYCLYKLMVWEVLGKEGQKLSQITPNSSSTTAIHETTHENLLSFLHDDTSNKNIHFEMILDVGIGEKRKETRFLI